MQLLELARKTHVLFRKQKPSEKRRLLNFVLSNCTWKGSELQAEFRQPLDMLVVATLPMKRKKVPELPPTTFLKIGSPGRTRTSDMVVNSHIGGISAIPLAYKDFRRIP